MQYIKKDSYRLDYLYIVFIIIKLYLKKTVDRNLLCSKTKVKGLNKTKSSIEFIIISTEQ